MKNNRRRRAVFEEPSYWQSFSDMMSALMLIFILIIAITLAIYRQKTTDLERTEIELNAAQKELDLAKEDLDRSREEIEASNKELADSLSELQAAYAQAQMTKDELDAAYQQIADAQQELSDTRQELQNIVGIRTDIIGELQNRFSNSSMAVDPQTGSITFSSDVLFDFNKSTLTVESQTALKEIIPMYLDVLLQDAYRPYIAEIIIEGHTDTTGGYDSNMTLSFNRANSVAKFCLNSNNGLTTAKTEQLRDLLTVNGRSYSDPIYQADGQTVDMEASRRVEIKFRLKEDEMIEKIAEILRGQEEASQ